MAIRSLQETNSIILYQLKHFWDIYSKSQAPLSSKCTHLNLYELILCFLFILFF